MFKMLVFLVLVNMLKSEGKPYAKGIVAKDEEGENEKRNTMKPCV